MGISATGKFVNEGSLIRFKSGEYEGDTAVVIEMLTRAGTTFRVRHTKTLGWELSQQRERTATILEDYEVLCDGKEVD